MTPKTETRMERGIRLFCERGDEIIEVEPGIYKVPSYSGEATYTVDLNRERCSCPDRTTRCKHLFAATIFAAKKRRCRRVTADRPQRRHGERQERSGEDRGRATDNTPARRDTRTAPRRDEVGSSCRDESLRGVLVNPDRLTETAEKLGV